MSTEQRDALPTLVQRFLVEDFSRWDDQLCSKPAAKELADTQTALREYLSASRLGAVREDDTLINSSDELLGKLRADRWLDHAARCQAKRFYEETDCDCGMNEFRYELEAHFSAHPVARVPEPATKLAKDSVLVADHILRFWKPVPESYDVYSAARRILTHAGLEIPQSTIESALPASLLVETTEPSERRVLVWLVERNEAFTRPVWLRSTLEDVEWTTDAYAAAQFETAYDANREITRRGGPTILFARAVEHSITYKSPGTSVETTDTPSLDYLTNDIRVALSAWREMRSTPFTDGYNSLSGWSAAYRQAERLLDIASDWMP